jgi:hypothetical protein
MHIAPHTSSTTWLLHSAPHCADLLSTSLTLCFVCHPAVSAGLLVASCVLGPQGADTPWEKPPEEPVWRQLLLWVREEHSVPEAADVAATEAP